jgi:hypothetical protein
LASGIQIASAVLVAALRFSALSIAVLTVLAKYSHPAPSDQRISWIWTKSLAANRALVTHPAVFESANIAQAKKQKAPSVPMAIAAMPTLFDFVT